MKLNQIDIGSILASHQLWCDGDPAGVCANLAGTDLRGDDLSETNLAGANLSGADMDEINLSGANLSGTNLRHAGLRGANLSGTDLVGADLTGADLRDANLVGANLTRTDLSGTRLDGADLWSTTTSMQSLIETIQSTGSGTVIEEYENRHGDTGTLISNIDEITRLRTAAISRTATQSDTSLGAYVTLAGETYSISIWTDIHGTSRGTLSRRTAVTSPRGIPVHEVIELYTGSPDRIAGAISEELIERGAFHEGV
jgi:hypothetical protein